LVEIDFYGDAPALRNDFKVRLTSGCIEASSLDDAPHWFPATGEAGKQSLARMLREGYEQVTSDDMVVLSRASNGMVAAWWPVDLCASR
jgi:hypothetical protein